MLKCVGVGVCQHAGPSEQSYSTKTSADKNMQNCQKKRNTEYLEKHVVTRKRKDSPM